MTKSLSKTLRIFMDWWRRELNTMLPASGRDWLSRPVPPLRVHLNDHQVSFKLLKGDELLPVTTLPVEEERSLAHHRDKLRKLLRRARYTENLVAIDLAKEQFASLHLKLPKATREYLGEVLRNEMDRYTPFSEDQVYFDFRVDEAEPKSDTVGVHLVLTPRRSLDEWLDRLTTLGLNVTHIRPDGDGDRRRADFNLIPKQRSSRMRRQRLTRVALTSAACLLLLVLSALLPISERRHAIAVVDARLSEARSAADDLARTRQKLEDLRLTAASLQSEKRSRPAVVALLAELTALLPDDTWLVQMNQRENDVHVAGYSANASSLIELLENSDLLENVRFDAPVTMDNETTREHFRIIASLETKD